MRKFAVASAVVLFSVTFVMAEDFNGQVKKVDGDKITVLKRGKKGDKGDEVTLTVAKDAKITKGKFNKETMKMEAGEAIEGGLKNEIFSKGDVGGRFTTNDAGAVTEIIIFTGKKGKDKNGK